MISKAIIRAYPLTTLIKVLSDSEVVKATAMVLKHSAASDYEISEIKNKGFTLSYLKEFYEKDVSGSKPLSAMAAKHKELIVGYFNQLLLLPPSVATYELCRNHNTLLNQIVTVAENIESVKQEAIADQ